MYWCRTRYFETLVYWDVNVIVKSFLSKYLKLCSILKRITKHNLKSLIHAKQLACIVMYMNGRFWNQAITRYGAGLIPINLNYRDLCILYILKR